MRRARIKADGAGYYHGMSRIIERRHILGDAKKAKRLTIVCLSPARFVFGHVDDLHGQTRSYGLFGGAFVALAKHPVALPPVIPHNSENG